MKVTELGLTLIRGGWTCSAGVTTRVFEMDDLTPTAGGDTRATETES
jgi:hypothetical protein